MNEVIIHRVRPSKRREWKPRTPYIPDKEQQKNVLDKEPENYIFQVNQLKEYLRVLSTQVNLVKSGINTYLEAGFFIPRNEFYKEDESFINFLKNHLGIQFILAYSQADDWSQAYFKIVDADLLVNGLKRAISSFEKFAKQEITLNEFSPKRISLFRYFRISTKEIKEQVTSHLKEFSTLRLVIDFIEPIENFNELLQSSAQSSGVHIEQYGEGIIEISDLYENNISNVAEFAKQISEYDKVMAIRMDDFVSTIHSDLHGQSYNFDVNILEVGENAPVVAVVDSGIQRNSLTDGFLTDEGIDFFSSARGQREDPFTDNAGHGTSVACEIVYGRALKELFFQREISELTSVAKIFPVKVFDGKEQTRVSYKDVFEPNGRLAKAVQKYGIKIINISFCVEEPKVFSDHSLSKAAYLMEIFAKQNEVIFVVCTGNISEERLSMLISKYPDFLFYSRPEFFVKGFLDKEDIENSININPPSDILSGITVGSVYRQRNSVTPSSFTKSFSISRQKYVKPDLVSEGGGDYPLEMLTTPPTFSNTNGRVAVASQDESLFVLDVGTSLSAPQVSRALAIEQVLYPELDALGLKSLLMHKLSKYKPNLKKYGTSLSDQSEQNEYVVFHESYGGLGCLPAGEEDILLSDSDNEVTYIIEDEIESNELLTYKVPIVKLMGDNTRTKTNKIELKMSICFNPDYKDEKPSKLSELNLTHMAAIAHLPGFELTHTHISKSGKEYKDRFISPKDPSFKEAVFIPWTSDYYQRYFPPFWEEKKWFIKDEIYEKLGENDEIEISVRCYSRDNKGVKRPFVVVFSIEDLGATGQVRNLINLEV